MTRADIHRVFWLHHVEGLSPSTIGRRVGAAHTTIEAVLSGAKWGPLTAGHRAVFGNYERWSPSDADLALMFRLHFADGVSLSAVGRRVGRLRPQQVRRYLTGETDAARTVELRARYGAYAQRSGRGHRRTRLTDETVRDLFVAYHEGGVPPAALAERYGLGRTTVREILTGAKGADQTGPLLARYGTTLRRPGGAHTEGPR